MYSSSRPPATQNRIPKVKDLCQALGFGGSIDRPEQDLKDSTQNWRKQYMTSDGTFGKDLTEWRLAKTQNDLLAMSRDYLEIGGWGKSHWPSNGNESPRSIPEYPRDQQKITNLLTQLFWRENDNQAHNAKHPGRGRRVQESVESDGSSATTLISPSTNAYPSTAGNSHFHYPSSRVPPQFLGSAAAYSRSASGPLPEGNSTPTTQKLRPPPDYTNLVKPRQSDPSIQLSGSLYVPSTNESDDASHKFPDTDSTLNGGATQLLHNDTGKDIFEYHDSDGDVRRQTSRLSKARENDERREEPQRRAPTANMQSPPVNPLPTPTKQRPEKAKITPPRKSPNVSISHRRSSAESRGGKRKDADGDDEDAEYTPQKRSKRRKPSPNDPDEWSIAKSKPVRRPQSLVPDEDDDSPLVRTVEHRGTALPSRSRAKRQNGSNRVSVNEGCGLRPFSPIIIGVDDLVDEGLEYLDTLQTSEKEQCAQPPLRRGAAQAEISPPPLRNAKSTTTVSEDPSLLPTGAPSVHPTNRINEEQNHSPTGLTSTHPTNAHRDPSEQPQPQPRPSPKPSIYYIIATRTPRYSQRDWPEGSLGEKSLEAMFSEVAAFTSSSKDFQRIVFKLTTSQKDTFCTVSRHDGGSYERMKKKFSKDINADLMRGNSEFEIELEPEPDPGEMGTQAEVEEGTVDPGFSF